MHNNIIEIPTCNRKGCGVVIKNLDERYYIDILNGFAGTRIECKNKGYVFPENCELGDTPIVGPYCEGCIDLYMYEIFGIAAPSYIPPPKKEK